MIFANIPYIRGNYCVVDRNGNVLHKYDEVRDESDDVPPDVAIRLIVSIGSDVSDGVIVEVA